MAGGVSPVRGLAKRAAWSAAVRMGLQVYDPNPENLPRLDELTEYVEDARPIGDKRPTTATDELPDLTLVPDALGGVVDVERFRGARVLEVGPKYGVHARWIDRELRPSELVFSDFESDSHLHAKWVGSLARPHRFVYGDLRDGGRAARARAVRPRLLPRRPLPLHPPPAACSGCSTA